jgi:two-component system, sensor histidine kinase LadS
MTPSDAKAEVANAIAKAKVELDLALVELDRVPAFDQAAIGFVAHALNNYLTVTQGTLELMKDSLADCPDQDVETWLESLLHCANLMQHTVERLLRVSGPNELALKPAYMDLPLLMERACQYYRRFAALKRQQLICRTVGDVPLAWADRVAVAVIADNLLSNAVKYAEVGGRIEVLSTAAGAGVLCTVRDDGPGLSEVDQSRLFQRGVRLSAVPTAGESSTGFGLAIAKEFVDRMGAKLWCESHPGQGACFSFWLPARPEGAAEG